MNQNDPFSHFNDDLNDPGSAPVAGSLRKELTQQRQEVGVIAPADRAHFEPCGKCGGSGQTRWGICFRCQGKGGKTFKTSSAHRAKARVQREDRNQRKLEAFTAEHPAEVAWLQKAAAWQANRRDGKAAWAFPGEVLDKLNTYHSLTDGQLDAIRRFMAKDAERAAQREQVKAAAPVIDASKLEAAFADRRAQRKNPNAEGVKWLKLHLAHKADGEARAFTFLDMPARGQWEAAIMVKEGETKLGRISGGKFRRSFACDDATEARVLAAASDPAAAAVAFGLEFSHCACCGLELTDPESIERGIGPICAEKWGFA